MCCSNWSKKTFHVIPALLPGCNKGFYWKKKKKASLIFVGDMPDLCSPLLCMFVFRLERRLEMMERDRQEMHERMEKRQQRRAREHQEQLRQQRVMYHVYNVFSVCLPVCLYLSHQHFLFLSFFFGLVISAVTDSVEVCWWGKISRNISVQCLLVHIIISPEFPFWNHICIEHKDNFCRHMTNNPLCWSHAGQPFFFYAEGINHAEIFCNTVFMLKNCTDYTSVFVLFSTALGFLTCAASSDICACFFVLI